METTCPSPEASPLRDDVREAIAALERAKSKADEMATFDRYSVVGNVQASEIEAFSDAMAAGIAALARLSSTEAGRGASAQAFVCVDPAGKPYWPSTKPTYDESLHECFGKTDAARLDSLSREGWSCVPVYVGASPPAREATGCRVPEKLRELSRRATPGPYYTVDQPWGDSTWIVAGNPDPHAGYAVAFCDNPLLSREEDREDAPDAIREADEDDDAAFLATSANFVRSLLAAAPPASTIRGSEEAGRAPDGSGWPASPEPVGLGPTGGHPSRIDLDMPVVIYDLRIGSYWRKHNQGTTKDYHEAHIFTLHEAIRLAGLHPEEREFRAPPSPIRNGRTMEAGMRLERVKLEPGWLAQEIEQVDLDIMAGHDPGDYFTRPLGMDARPMSDTEKHRLFMRLEARFKAWTKESFAAFMLRTGGDDARS